MKKILLLLISIISILPAHAEWKLLIQHDRFNSYIETNSIKSKGKIVSYWMMEDHTTFQTDWFSMKFKSENNCDTDEFRHISLHHYSEKMGQGKRVSGNNDVEPWQHVIPDTIGETVHKFVCKKR